MFKSAVYLSMVVASALTVVPTQLQYPVQAPVAEQQEEQTESIELEETKETIAYTVTDGVNLAGFKEDNLINYNNNTKEVEVMVVNKVEKKSIERTYFTKTNVNLRKNYSLNSDVIKVVNYGEPVYVISELSNGWSNVNYNGYEGYMKTEYLSETSINYTDYSLSVFGYNSSFKSFMPYSAITNRSSMQWKLQQQASTTSYGLRTIGGRVCVAIGTYFGAEVGTKIDLIMENGSTIQAIVADIKDDRHTDGRNIQTFDGSCVEVLVHMASLPEMVRRMGDMSYMSDAWKGNISKIRVFK